MTFQELLKSNEWLSVKLTMEKLFPDQNDLMDDYEKVFHELKTMRSVKSNVTINVQWVHDDFDDIDYVDVSGYYTDPADRNDEYSNSLGIEFTPWEEWLTMPIDEKSLKEFSQLELITHCLYEITFVGFDQEEIQEELDKLNEIADDYSNSSPEDKVNRTYSLDDIRNMFNDDDENEDTADEEG